MVYPLLSQVATNGVWILSFGLVGERRLTSGCGWSSVSSLLCFRLPAKRVTAIPTFSSTLSSSRGSIHVSPSSSIASTSMISSILPSTLDELADVSSCASTVTTPVMAWRSKNPASSNSPCQRHLLYPSWGQTESADVLGDGYQASRTNVRFGILGSFKKQRISAGRGPGLGYVAGVNGRFGYGAIWTAGIAAVVTICGIGGSAAIAPATTGEIVASLA
ncbi:MAG: hypothetical protein NXY57DRAFT_970061 [Lentinula lateritia]|nr:MAG: hypothetical protein NXY57DRAFT_970061 [Lentinula lateritia]